MKILSLSTSHCFILYLDIWSDKVCAIFSDQYPRKPQSIMGMWKYFWGSQHCLQLLVILHTRKANVIGFPRCVLRHFSLNNEIMHFRQMRLPIGSELFLISILPYFLLKLFIFLSFSLLFYISFLIRSLFFLPFFSTFLSLILQLNLHKLNLLYLLIFNGVSFSLFFIVRW